MKREQTTSWLHFRMLYCTGAYLIFIGWLCVTEPINSVALLVSKYGGEKFLGNTAVLDTSSGPYAKHWVGEAEGNTDVS